MIHTLPPRQLILCFDGTNNNLTGGVADTNVVKLRELLDPDANNQIVYYDPGVGNVGELPGVDFWDRFGAGFNRIKGLALGGGIYENIAQGYRFLMEQHRTGDQIFLFGFSRGAFTARSVGGMVHTFGLLKREHAVLVDTLVHWYFSDRHADGNEQHGGFTNLRAQIRRDFARQTRQGADGVLLPIWFTGVWDTVESVGWPGFRRKITGSPTVLGKAHLHVRQALALDEFRTPFLPRMFAVHPDASKYTAANQSIKQEWFAGCHADVGGGYRSADSGLGAGALEWLADEAASAQVGLRLKLGATFAIGAKPVAHNELARAPIWALAGMTVRDPQHNPLAALPMPDAEHPNHEYLPPQTVHAAPLATTTEHMRWGLGWGWGWAFWLALLAIVPLAVLHGAVLRHGWAGVASGSMLEWFPPNTKLGMGAAMCANIALCKFQLLGLPSWPAWLWPDCTAVPPTALPGAGAALWVDLALIAAYAVVLAHFSAWAFLQLARSRGCAAAHLPHPRRTMLNRLGQAPKWAILADLAENMLTASVLSTGLAIHLPFGQKILGVLMGLASAGKWLMLGASCILLSWALVDLFAQKIKKSP